MDWEALTLCLVDLSAAIELRDTSRVISTLSAILLALADMLEQEQRGHDNAGCDALESWDRLTPRSTVKH